MALHTRWKSFRGFRATYPVTEHDLGTGPGARFSKAPESFRVRTAIFRRLKILVWAPGLFLESSGNFSDPESHSKMSNLRVTELFYSRILNMNRGSLHTRSFRRIHFSVLKTDDPKISLRARKVFEAFENWGPFLESPGNVLCPERQSKISNLTITEPFYSLIFNMNGVFFYTRSLDTDELKISQMIPSA